MLKNMLEQENSLVDSNHQMYEKITFNNMDPEGTITINWAPVYFWERN